MTFFAGLDLGQAQDYTALCVAERVTPKSRMTQGFTDLQKADFEWLCGDLLTLPDVPTQPVMYHIKHLARLPLGTSYPDVVTHVQQLTTIPALRELRLAVDATGVGAPVIDLLTAARLRCPVFAVHIHGGDAISHEGIHYRVPKRNLIDNAQVLLQTNRVKIAAGLPEAATLVNELLNYRLKIDPTTAHDSYNAREGVHDDVVLATCLALWLGETIGDGPQIRAL